jgi:hypothetical protein
MATLDACIQNIFMNMPKEQLALLRKAVDLSVGQLDIKKKALQARELSTQIQSFPKAAQKALYQKIMSEAQEAMRGAYGGIDVEKILACSQFGELRSTIDTSMATVANLASEAVFMSTLYDVALVEIDDQIQAIDRGIDFFIEIGDLIDQTMAALSPT